MIKTAVIGATGVVGQSLLRRLCFHPWFEITHAVASERSAGKKMGEVLIEAELEGKAAEKIKDMEITGSEGFSAENVDLIFSCVDSATAKKLEPEYAQTTPVVSTTSAFRMDPYTPILIGGVNPEHTEILRIQQQKYNWKGFIAPKPNCIVAGLAISLKPILSEFGLKRVAVTSMQSLSGAGRSPGVGSLDIIDNILPYIPGEEDKIETEPQKILGQWQGESIVSGSFTVDATSTRVPVLDGHLSSVVVETEEKTKPEEVKEAMLSFGENHKLKEFPSAPESLLTVTDNPFRPQPRLDRNKGEGMTVTAGRVEKSTLFSYGIKYLVLTPNTGIGAAGGAVLMAEVLVRKFSLG